MTDRRIDDAPRGAIDYIAVEESAPFRELKRRQRSFVFPFAVAFLVWYFAYVLLSSFAPEFMARPVTGAITVGLLIGLGQFATTFAITMGYVAYANRRLDPVAEQLRADLERTERGES